MKRTIILGITLSLLLMVLVGCDVEVYLNEEAYSNTSNVTGQYQSIEYIPGQTPQLFVNISAEGLPVQRFQAVQSSTHWFPPAFFDSAIGMYIPRPGYSATGEHPLNYWRETLGFSGNIYGIENEIEISIDSDFPPTTIKVRRWRTDYIGVDSINWNKYESIDITDNTFRIFNNGNDYIYEIEAIWVQGEHLFGRAFYSFRLNGSS